MANRIEPFRDYSEHEVVNLFALDLAGLTLADMKNLGAAGNDWDSGVAVKASGGGLAGDIPSGFATDSAVNNAPLRAYLGYNHESVSGNPSHIGRNDMPINTLTVAACGDDDTEAIGLTLRQTLAYDENGENLLRYPVKKDELQAVGPGETVPVLTRGLVILNADGMDGTPVQGDPLECAADGKLKKVAGGGTVVGRVLAVGDSKYLCKLSF